MRNFPASAPSLLLVGEVRDTETVNEIIQTVLNGARVIFTFHAATAEETIIRLLSMCQGNAYAREILAVSLRLLVNLSKAQSLPGQMNRVSFQYLEGTDQVAAAIRAGSATGIKDVYVQQKNARR